MERYLSAPAISVAFLNKAYQIGVSAEHYEELRKVAASITPDDLEFHKPLEVNGVHGRVSLLLCAEEK